MRKNILSLSIAAMVGGLGLAGGASAGVIAAADFAATPATELRLANGGVGHMLITPYFTAQGGNATVLSIVNTDTQRGKAVKVRFRGGSNSDDILDFQVFLSPSDHWSAVVTKNATTGLAQIVTNDNSCTIPKLTPGVAQSFITGRLPSYASAAELANGTLEGYVEMFNMADIPLNSSTSSLYASILHSSAGVPRNCDSTTITNGLADITSAGAATTVGSAIGAGYTAPTTGLMGNWTIINVPNTTTFSGSMAAIRATTAAGVDASGNFVWFPQSDVAASTTATVNNVTADPLFRSDSSLTKSGTGVLGAAVTAAVTAAYYDLPDMSTPYVGTFAAATDPGRQAAALTGAIATTSIRNEYATDPSVNATTDWVFSMPTRRYSVAVAYGTTVATSARRFSVVSRVAAPTATTQWFSSDNTTLSADKVCVTAQGQKFWDREEQSVSSGAVFSPGSVATFRFCGETSVTSFGTAASVLGATLATQSTGSSAKVNGWGAVDTTNSGLGLPIVGAAFIKLTNANASAGVSGTYGITSDHRFTIAP
jgi:hypothetical protein